MKKILFLLSLLLVSVGVQAQWNYNTLKTNNYKYHHFYDSARFDKWIWVEDSLRFGDGTTQTSAGWAITGNASTVAGTNFIGTTDAQSLVFKVSNSQSGKLDTHGSVYFGTGAGASATIGTANVAIGYNSLSANIAGYNNIATRESSGRAYNGLSKHIYIGGKGLTDSTCAIHINENPTTSKIDLNGNLYVSGTGVWKTTGNSGTIFSDFIGTTDNVDLVFKVNDIVSGRISHDQNSIVFGEGSLNPTFTGVGNYGMGEDVLTSLTIGIDNVAMGRKAMDAATSASCNVALSDNALGKLISGNKNTIFITTSSLHPE